MWMENLVSSISLTISAILSIFCNFAIFPSNVEFPQHVDILVRFVRNSVNSTNQFQTEGGWCFVRGRLECFFRFSICCLCAVLANLKCTELM